MLRLKETWWELRAEIRSLALWFLSGFPLRLGIWLRAQLMPMFFKRIGRNTVIQMGLRVTSPEQISIGANCSLGQGIFLTGGGGISIGDWVGIGPDAKIWSVNHRFDDPDQPWMLQGFESKPVTIENDVWLGASVFILPGVTIGKGAIISAGSVVNKAVPAYALVAGNPGRVIGWRKAPQKHEGNPAPVASSGAV